VVALEARRRTAPTIYDRRPGTRATLVILAAILVLGALLRVWEIDAVGLNSDEAVYAGQGASIAGVDALAPYFPTFRAHPLLFQTLLSIGFEIGNPELFGRLAAAALGLATVGVGYLAGDLMYGRRAGLIAAAVLALMPYHVIVTRQILLDGPMVLCSTTALYLIARYALTERVIWLYAAGAALGLTVLSKEGSVILLGAVYAFLALTPSLRTGMRHIAGAGALFAVIVSAFPLSLAIAGKTGTGGNFLAWQLFRRPNHDWLFYPTVVSVAIGLLAVAAAGLGLWVMRRDASWRETLLLSWIAIPVGFFQLFPVKGFQYLLPIAPAVALLAGRFLANWRPTVPFNAGALRAEATRWAMPAACAAVLLSLLVPAWIRIQPSTDSTFLAGSGGVPGGREAGLWIADNVPAGARMMSIGPSMANILQYYGHRKIYGLSVSPNPLHRNPVYEAMRNPDRLIRDNELQYVVWDAFSADRSPFFSRKIIRYVERYHGRPVHTRTVPVRTPAGKPARKPVIVIYEVRP
jgi:4-amino-4-deoxy-L-arabinose transferase-like glycosyltransferase